MNLIAYIPLLLQGTSVTFGAWVIAASISMVIGICMGIIGCHYLASSSVSAGIRLYTFIAKGVPVYVQILIAYFVIPALLGISLSGFFAAVGALAFCSSGYVTEIVRSTLNAIPRGQWEACFVLGYPLHETLRRIIVPQMVRNALPALLGELDQLLKSSALLATIGITELTRTGMNIISRELNPIPVYLLIACIYLVFSAVLQGVMLIVEKKVRYGNR